jgi:hypothetical protein
MHIIWFVHYSSEQNLCCEANSHIQSVKVKWNPYLTISLGAMDLYTKLGKTFNGGNLTQIAPTGDHWNFILNKGKPKIVEY